MPTPAKTSRDALVGIARALVDAGGAEALTVSAVAQQAGVKPPSLYKHFTDRAAILKAVEISVLHDLEQSLRAGTKGSTHARQRLHSMAQAYRRFASSQPHRYGVIYSREAFDDPEIEAACRFAAQPLFEELARAGVPASRILPLSRTLAAFLHGFVSMEIIKAFRLGGDLDRDFEDSVATILAEVDDGPVA